MIVSIASFEGKWRGIVAMSLGETIEFLPVFRKQAKNNDDFYSECEHRALLSNFSLDFAASRS